MKNNGRMRKEARQEAAAQRERVSPREKQGQPTGIDRKMIEDDMFLQQLTTGYYK
jgi:hypothetical protein